MPIKWSAKKVMRKLEEIDELLREVSPVIQQCAAKAREIQQLPEVPEYICQPARMMAYKLSDIVPSVRSRVIRIREKVPEGALELEESRGEQNQLEL